MLASGIIGEGTVQDELGGEGSDASRQTSFRSSTSATSSPTSTGTSPPEQRAAAGSRSGAINSQRRASDTTGPDVQLSIDEGTNTLIVVAEPRVTQQIEDLIRQLDVRQSQVMLEVLIVTLTEGQTLDLGVELEDIKIDGQTRLRLASLFGLATRGADGSVSTGNAAGFSAVVLNPGDFSVVIRALQTINAGRAQSMPKLLVGNNQQATLDSVLQQPFASVNASNTVSTTSFGGTQDAGTTVTIKPQIAEGDHLVLDYSVSLSSFLGSASQPTLPPPRQQNRIRSVATIPDGHTVVVGGIELENDSKTTAQVPLLGQIPIIGEAFKSRGKTTNRTRFYVFIRATVLRGRGFEDLRYLSNQNMAEAGIDDGWPTSTPRVIR
jgi:general secretion pathway protein D